MVRKNKQEESDQKPTWRKITRGTLYPFPAHRNRRVKHKESIEATALELGSKLNQFELVHPGTGVYKIEKHPGNPVSLEVGKTEAPAKEAPTLSKEVKKETYEVVTAPDTKGGEAKGWYNVVSSTGKVMNDKKLRATDAAALKESLEAETGGDD